MLQQQLKSSLRHIAAWVYYASRIYLTLHRGKVLILMYHRVLSEKELKRGFVQPGMYVLDNVFERHIEFLVSNYDIISFDDLLNIWREKEIDKAKRYCVITFDDGWLDNYIYAYPILKRHKIPAAIFLPTSYIGTNQWFWMDRLSYLLNGIRREKIDRIIEAFKEISVEKVDNFIDKLSERLEQPVPDERIFLNWEEVQEMSQHDISFGSHSSTHKIMTMLSLDEIRKELRESMDILQEKGVKALPVFCYPNGNYNEEIIKEVKATGYQSAVTTGLGIEDTRPQDLFRLKRIGIHNDITAAIPLFSLRLSAF